MATHELLEDNEEMRNKTRIRSNGVILTDTWEKIWSEVHNSGFMYIVVGELEGINAYSTNKCA